MHNSIAWWPTLAAMIAASVLDMRMRRIPNWITLPFLLSGLAIRTVIEGTSGLTQAAAGLALAAGIFAVPCFLRLMGMGDLKLIVGLGAWVGPGQLILALVVMAIAGGLIAVCAHFSGRSETCGDAPARFIPYAPAIAVGALFSFFAV